MPHTSPAPEIVELVSFDGGVTERGSLVRPDRYWMLEAGDGSAPRIARGGGYSYAAASFGAGSLVTLMTRFNRVVALDGESVEVEAGMSLGELLAITAPKGLWLPVQPGYPAITVGGCIAANVHGKNPFSEGTFSRLVESLTLFHPRYGTIVASPDSNREVFELTCGGYGLTGVILKARLRLAPIPGWTMSVERVEVGGALEALDLLPEMTNGSAFAYTWHDAVPRGRTLGRGFVYRGTIRGTTSFPAEPPKFRRIDAKSRARLPISLMGSMGAGLLARGFWMTERRKPNRVDVALFDAMFPFARRGEYFLLFGRSGFAEYQAIVPDNNARGYLEEMTTRLLKKRAPGVMLSMKRFRGVQRLLRFEQDGVCITLNLARDETTAEFLADLDRICIEAGGIPNLIKDSRLSAETVRRCYGECDSFAAKLLDYDPDRIFRSELSERLEL